MQHSKKLIVLILISLGSAKSMATSLVYNLKIRRTFAGASQLIKREKKTFVLATAVPIIYERTAHIVNEQRALDLHDKRFGGGTIFNVRYVPSRSWWFEGTTAVQKETTHTQGTAHFRASQSGFDDIVLSGGYNAFPSDDTQLTLYGLAGFPTKTSVTLQEAQDRLVGTRFYSIGAGAEGSYSFITKQDSTLTGILQIRVLHFFSREWETILGVGGRIQPGHLLDFLISVRYRYYLTAFEVGYNPTIAVHQALITPAQTLTSKPLVRHGFFADVLHLTQLHIGNHPLAVGAGVSANRVHKIDATQISWWINLTLIF